jgi:hypothetical protein
LDALRKCRTPNHVHDALRSLPKTLDETYDHILASVNETDREYAFRALQWVAFAARPVSLEEVAEAMIIDLYCEEPSLNRGRELSDPHEIVDICASLVSLSEQTEAPKKVLQLTHFSVKEHLVSSTVREGKVAWFSLQEDLAHESIAECCLAYLLDKENCGCVGISACPLFH